MAAEFDEIIRRLDPARDRGRYDAFDERADAILGQVFETNRPRRRVLIAAIAAAVVVAIASAAGAAWYLSGGADPNNAVLCFSSVEPDAVGLAIYPEDVLDEGVCRDLWREGGLVNPAVEPGTVPDLQPCVLPSKTLAVFPSSDPALCEVLDLAEFDGPIESSPSMRLQVLVLFDPGECVAMNQAAARVEALLDAISDDRWVIAERAPNNPAAVCASASVDAERRVISLVPVPPAPS